MATPINKSEQKSEDAITADSIKNEPFPLPGGGSQIKLQYENKVTEEQILSCIDHKFFEVTDANQKSVDDIPANTLMLADNFFGLHKLLDCYREKVQLFYLDPPYGTGGDFQSRDLLHAYKDSLGISTWVEFMRRRLILMRELLSSDGSIYVHIGHQNLFHLKVIMDEVFGPDNFRNLIVRRKCSSKNSTRNQYPNLNDYILFYSKSSKFKWNRPGVPASKEWIDKEYSKSDEKGRYKLVPIHAPGTRNGETGQEWRGMMPPPGKHWQLKPSKLEELDLKGEMYWSKNGNPRRKVYLPENKELPLTDYWDQYRDAHHQSIKITGYPTEKNFDMMKKIIEASSDEGDLVIDPFNGSGTTIHAAKDLNRKFIGIEQSFTGIETTLKRLKYEMKAMGDYVTEDNTPNSKLTESSVLNFIVDGDILEHHKLDIIDFLNK